MNAGLALAHAHDLGRGAGADAARRGDLLVIADERPYDIARNRFVPAVQRLQRDLGLIAHIFVDDGGGKRHVQLCRNGKRQARGVGLVVLRKGRRDLDRAGGLALEHNVERGRCPAYDALHAGRRQRRFPSRRCRR